MEQLLQRKNAYVQDTNITLKTPASVLDGKSVNGSGSITYIGDTGDADLSKVDVGTSFSSDSTFTGTLEDDATYNGGLECDFHCYCSKSNRKEYQWIRNNQCYWMRKHFRARIYQELQSAHLMLQ